MASYDFSSIQTLAEVGGGHGSLLVSILEANPHLQGILFEQPAVIAGAQPLIAARGVSDRCQLVVLRSRLASKE